MSQAVDTDTQVREILKRRYLRVIAQDPDDQNIWLACIPEFQGCWADGETPLEALARLEDAAQAWVAASLRTGFPIAPPLDNFHALQNAARRGRSIA